MKRKGLLVLMVVTLVLLVGCKEGSPPPGISDADWMKISTTWMDADSNEFSYVPSGDGDGHIDIQYNPSDTVQYRCYIEEFTYANNRLTGTYTYFDTESALQGPFDVTIDFSYASASGVLTLVYSGQGTGGDVLNGITMNLTVPTP